MRWYTVSAIALLVALSLTRLLQVVGASRNRRRHPPLGRLLGPAQRRRHVRFAGQGTGPTVVIEQGAGGFAALWWPLQDAVAEFARVLSYDRLGIAWSDPAGLRSVDRRVEELSEMLEAADAAPPYVLVAHSYGGIIVRRFAKRYPERMAALVLVDSLEEGSYFRPEVLRLYARFCRILSAIAYLQALGLPRLWRTLFPDAEARKDSRRAAMASLSLEPALYRGKRDDFRSLTLLPDAERQPWEPGTFGSLPLVVITHGQPFPGPFAVVERHWEPGQRRLAALSTNSLFIVARNSNHMIQDDEPMVVVDAIRRARTAAAEGRPLG
jgi:pimeloyl-ACP methyl ester carboxylesterase